MWQAIAAIGQMGPNDCMALVYVCLAVMCLFTIFALMKWNISPNAALAAWAEKNGLELLEVRRRSGWYGLFRLPRTTAQPIYRIKVRERTGDEFYGIARIGGFFGLGKHVRVIWEKERQ